MLLTLGHLLNTTALKRPRACPSLMSGGISAIDALGWFMLRDCLASLKAVSACTAARSMHPKLCRRLALDQAGAAGCSDDLEHSCTLTLSCYNMLFHIPHRWLLGSVNLRPTDPTGQNAGKAVIEQI